MAKKKQPRKPHHDDDIRGRVIHLLETIWHNNRAVMAAEVGFSHTSINNVANGHRAPGRRLLQAIAEHPKVNPAWLLRGEGTPLLAPRPDAPAGDWTVPISQVLLPGPPKEYHELLTDQRWPVCASDYHLTRYFLELQHEQPILRRDREKFARGDLLLFDTDHATHSRIDVIHGAICILRGDDDSDGQLQLARVRPVYDDNGEEVPGRIQVDTFDRGLNKSDLVIRMIVDLDQHGVVKAHRSVPLRVNPTVKRDKSTDKPELVRVAAEAISPGPQFMSSDRIVAVCVLCVRRSP
jgi:hypothetical protein